MATQKHRDLVQALVRYFLQKGLEVTHVAGDHRYPDPYQIGRHEPDVLAEGSLGQIWIGEAKTGDGDFERDESIEQFTDFAAEQPGRVVIGTTATGKLLLEHQTLPKNPALRAVLDTVTVEAILL